MIKHLSVSSVNTYETCPRMFKFQYVDKLMGLPSKALDIGKFVHEGIELFHNGKDAISVLKKKILVNLDKENIELFRVVRRCIDNYIKNPINKKNVAHELKCEFILEDSKGNKIDIPFLGFIDGITENGIVEYKTTSEDYEQSKVDESLQATIYAYFFFKLYKKFPKEIKYWIVNKVKLMKDLEYKPQILTTKRGMEHIDAIMPSLIETYKNIKEEKFDCRCGDHCHWCSFRNFCNKK